ncbi:MAG TPA: malectin domain-containing carbohydrate-binding protein, partial [Capsulimonadaceae bacterium]|nr:malectin domain-containing carbohydrate-binding protein [Capsulimonadaceae bacterium]
YASAFRKAATGQVVVVAINQNSVPTNLTVNLPAYSVSTLTPYRTSATENLAALTPFSVSGHSFTYTLAPQSVTSFAGQGVVSNPSAPLSIDAGGVGSGAFTPDFDFTAGNMFAVASAIDTSGVASPAPQEVYQTMRWGQFNYAIPGLTPAQKYTVRLHFAETYWTGPGERLFTVAINGRPVLSNFDVFQAAGGQNKALVKQFTIKANAQGKITIQFINGPVDNAMVSGIEVLPIG